MFYIILFAVLAVVLVVAGSLAISRRRARWRAEEAHDAAARDARDAGRRKTKAQRAQSQHDRRKRH